MKNLLRLPKQEEVTEINVNGGTMKVVELTDENRPAVLEFVLSQYENDVCVYCKRTFTPEEVRKSIWAHDNPHGRIVHRACWNKHNPHDQR